jgi:UDP-N-acetylmuramoyl-tripeptide--D-alanyl-D-alanine ligase
MKYITLADLKKLPNSYMVNEPSLSDLKKNVRGISIDSRSLKANQIFWAYKGPKFDGHNFIIDAIKQGAAAVVINKSHAHKISAMGVPVLVVKDSLISLQKLAAQHRRKFNIPVLAITGTNGKTTTKEMIAWILQTKMNVHRTWGNLNNHIGVPLSLLNLNSEHDVSIIELGTNHPGEIAALSAITRPTAGLITNIGRGHLEFFETIEGVAREKIELFNFLKSRGVIFLNRDDPLLPNFRLRRKTLWSYSLDNDPDVKVSGRLIELSPDANGLWELNEQTRIQMNVPGLHNVQNALAASAVALYFGFSEQEIKSALESYRAYDKRMQIMKNGEITIINDSYNANPDSYLPALQTMEHMAEKNNQRKIVVIGDMLELGPNADALHRDLMLKLLEFNVDGIFTLGSLTSLNARIVRERGFQDIFSFESHQELGESLREFMKPGDIILIKGSRGMQMEKVLASL